VTLEHEISAGIGCIRLVGVISRPDVNMLIVIVGDYVRDAQCSSIKVDMIAVTGIGELVVGALTALKGMASIHDKPLSVVVSHGKVRDRLQRAGLLARE
jgi:hypothetical protein